MPNVVFVVPFAMPNSLRFVRAVARLPEVRLGLVSQDPIERLPLETRQLPACYAQVEDALDADRLEVAVRSLGRQLGSVDSLLGILEPLQEPLAEVRHRLGVPGMGTDVAMNFRDKARMKDVLSSRDLPCARHRLCANAEQAAAFVREAGFPLVAKPPAGAGAKATARLENAAELAEFLAGARPQPGRELLLEEFVQGREFSFDSVTLHGRHMFHSVSEYHPTPLQVLENPWIQWCVVLPRVGDGPEFEEIAATGPLVLSALGMETGMTHMEWFRRGDGSITIGEVAARPPGAQFMTLISYAHDIDMYRAWGQLMIFEAFVAPQRSHAVGAAYLRGQAAEGRSRGSVLAITGIEAVQREFGDVVVEAKLPQKGQTAVDSYEGDGYVIVRHPETEVVESALAKIVSTLRVELG